MASWKKISSETVIENKWTKIFRDKVIMPNGKEGEYTYVSRINGNCIIPIEGEYVYMVSQYRYPVQETLLQFPMEGFNKDENVDAAVSRCTEEELGKKAINAKKIGEAWVDGGLNTQKLHFYTCELGETVNQKLDDSEADLKIEKVRIADLYKYVKEGRIKDFHTLSALYYFELDKYGNS
jgi:ADP-ribose pyrophosphatase